MICFHSQAPCGLVGFDFALPEALGKCKRAIEKNDGANASKILKDISDLILEATGKLSESVYEAEYVIFLFLFYD